MSEWIKPSMRLPERDGHYLVSTGGQVREAIYYGYNQWYRASDRNCAISPDFWQPLPDPPPRESSFEQWWRDLPVMGSGIELGDFEMRGVTMLGTLHHPIKKGAARNIWQSAIAASKRSDFVP